MRVLGPGFTTNVEQAWEYLTARVVEGKWIFAGQSPLPTFDPEGGLHDVLDALQDQGWELDPGSELGSEAVLLRRPIARRRAVA